MPRDVYRVRAIGVEALRHFRVRVSLENRRPHPAAGEGDRGNQRSRAAPDERDVRRRFHLVRGTDR